MKSYNHPLMSRVQLAPQRGYVEKSVTQRQNENLMYRTDNKLEAIDKNYINDPKSLNIIKKGTLVRIIKKDNEKASARLRFYVGRNEYRWVPILLDKKSLEECDLREGDSFVWKIRKDGVVKLEDIIHHPRISTPEEVEESRKVFEDLRKEAEGLRKS